MVPKYNLGHCSEDSQEEHEGFCLEAARLLAEVACPRIAVKGHTLGKVQQRRPSYVKAIR